MLLLNSALHKGIVGALSAILFLSIIFMFNFFKSACKRYFRFLRHKDTKAIGSWEIIGFAVLVLVIVWIITFSILCSTVNRRTLSESDNAWVAALLGVLVCAAIIYSYWQHFKFSPISFSWAQALLDKVKSPYGKSNVSKFNLFYSFKFLPDKLTAFSKGEICFSDAISTSSLPKEYLNFASKIKPLHSGVKNKPDLEMTLMDLPSTKSIGEVNCILIIRNSTTKEISLYTLEFSIQDFCVCLVGENFHANIGTVENGQQFATVVLKHYFDNVKTSKPSPTENFGQVQSVVTSELPDDCEDFIELVPQKDIYGRSLTERTEDIFLALKYGTDTFCENLFGLPCLSEEGKMEVYIVLASLLSVEIQKEIIIQSLMTGDSRFKQLGIKLLNEKIETYAKMFKSHILRDFVKQSWPLLDFARNSGSLKICEFLKPDSFGYLKRPVFCKEGEKPLLCHFAGFARGDLNPTYIAAHKKEIIVEERSNGEYVLIPLDDVGFLKECFVSYVAYHIFCHPLKLFFSLNYGDIDTELGKIQMRENNVSFQYSDMPNPSLKMYPIIRNALEESKNETEAIASSCGLI